MIKIYNKKEWDKVRKTELRLYSNATAELWDSHTGNDLSIEDISEPLRDVFVSYEFLAYMSVRATQIGMKSCEVPVTRAYPRKGKTPTKISFFKGNWDLMKTLIKNAFGAYNP